MRFLKLKNRHKLRGWVPEGHLQDKARWPHKLVCLIFGHLWQIDQFAWHWGGEAESKCTYCQLRYKQVTNLEGREIVRHYR